MKRTKIAPATQRWLKVYARACPASPLVAELLALLRLANEAREWSRTPPDANRKPTVDARLVSAVMHLQKVSAP